MNLDADRILPYDVQAAYNGTTFFWRLSYDGEEGKRHQYLRYTNGVWNKEGGDRRDAQATIDNDPQQGDTNILTTIYEQRTSIMVNDPNAATNVDGFGEHGCFLACHNVSRHMPEWTSASGHDGKYINPADAGSPSGTPVLDLWHWRGARSNPIGRSDDQNILSLDFVDSSSDDDGGRKGDAGTSVFFNQGLDVNGDPDFVLDSATTNGAFAFNWDNFWTTPFYYMTQDDAVGLGPDAPNPGIMTYADAILAGYSPVEGDTVPRRILRAGAGSRADISSFGTTFTPGASGNIVGRWNVQIQRALDTGNVDDIAMLPGRVYEAGFEVHLWEYTTRDHYVSFPVTVSVGTGLGADIEAVDLTGVVDGGPESALNIDWDAIPVTTLYLFQPGITSWGFLTGDNEAMGKQYVNAEAQLVDQAHAGSMEVNLGTACVACHTVRTTGDPAPPMFNAGAMEDLTGQRGGIWENTPVVAAAPTTTTTTTTAGATTTTAGATTTTAGATTTTAGATTTTAGATTTTTLPPVGVAADGQAKYDQANAAGGCRDCHAAGAFDTTGFAGDLAGTTTTVSDLTGINAAMGPDTSPLTPQEVLDLQAFFDSL